MVETVKYKNLNFQNSGSTLLDNNCFNIFYIPRTSKLSIKIFVSHNVPKNGVIDLLQIQTWKTTTTAEVLTMQLAPGVTPQIKIKDGNFAHAVRSWLKNLNFLKT